MRLYGMEKYSLVDYDGHIACTVFTAGCNMRCPFCHNAQLVVGVSQCTALDEREFWSYLAQRKGLVDAVCITGGEPTLRPDLPLFVSRVRDLGYKVKLDTNGTNPDLLSAMIDAGMLDYVAMDIKNAPALYEATCGKAVDMAAIRRSANLLLAGKIDYEFRTTVVAGLHTVASIEQAAKFVQGAKQYYLQCFADKGGNLQQGLQAVDADTMQAMAQAAMPYADKVRIRGL